ncbi:MAG: hypothetical protein A2W98_01070 [Bacteroidetes bacterium GWF2_33_38]|nr:MAG: hypothetical protein A2W98_01070 [Bacteroidetes bacterium GWF2_33_38]OFY91651.1 MAG: hypothetical protein A2236_09435 [Bacteroidetes bacterium RIFOXYA2_FULL_33_7]
MKIKIFVFIFFICSNFFAQDIQYARKVIDSLCSKSFNGRAYVFDGDKLAAQYIESELKKKNIKNFGNTFFQPFTVSANTFPKNVIVKVDGKELIAGTEFVPFPQTAKCTGKFNIEYLDKQIINDKYLFRKFLNSKHSKNVVAIDTVGISDKELRKLIEYSTNFNLFNAKAILSIDSGHLRIGISSSQAWFPSLRISSEAISNNSKILEIKLLPKFVKDYQTQNIIGYIEGESDSVIVFSAHYDHLGAIGNQAYFYGANDNASGVSMLLDLARHYSQQKPKYTIVFMFFSAEEIGLLGSKYYTENPLFPLSKIKFLFNLDMVGTGDEGICLVNGKVFEKEANLLIEINKEKELLPDVSQRGKASNSDHHFFFENAVRCFFIYARGGIGEYHNVFDKPETLPLTEYEDFFRLLTNFIERYE